ncbi:MAG: YajG family lipoprotein [Myxococcaceae bacterium]|nr:YajG family lipoprotein [Myxococcaceae bacterium]MCI0669916.1 YajG family lipoprotein [Myxococcaceae bacterium]
MREHGQTTRNKLPSRGRLGVVLVGCLALMGCETTRYAVSRSGPSLPRFAFSGLQSSAPFRVEVVDHRSERQESEALTESVTTLMSQALTSAGVALAPDGTARLEVRVQRYRADFELGQWKGCSKLMAIIERPGTSPLTVTPQEKCVTRSNLWGYRSGDEALEAAFYDTVAELLSTMDASAR